ncbi:zinc ribbon domain-containing protein [Streptomyces sp. NPDC059593]|uniref:zinc ribbon domain-containing protein n=1 Tax=Streptomyces sp. NPDC059593 TaxID=3346878 RepID=UPI0036CE71E3
MLRKVADAYTGLRANLKAGNLGRRGSKRHGKATGKPVVFRPDAAQPFDDRCLSWQLGKRTVSIWTTSGRVKGLAFTGQAGQLAVLTTYRQGESDLLCQGGRWYLLATCEIPEAALNAAPDGFVGVDLGIVNIATASTGIRYSGRRLNRRRDADRRLRARLQRKGTKSAKRRAKRHAGKEARRALVYVDPAYTSQECSRCHHVDRRNRPSQAVFACQACGFVEHADLNSSHNIAARGWWTWVRGAESQAPALTLTA